MNRSAVFVISSLVVLIVIVFSLIFFLNKKPQASTVKNNDNITKEDLPLKKEPQDDIVPETKPKHEITQEGGVTYVDGYLIVNKTYALPENYGGGLTKETENAFYKMQAAAKEEGLNLFMRSGYRSYLDQKIIYNDYVREDGQTLADTYSARPGHSEHQSGLAMDLNSLDQDFGDTPEGKWLNANCYKFGFIIRYPYGKEDKTGYMYEPWHVRYVGADLSYKLYNNGSWLTMEEYFDLTSKYE